MPRSRSQLERFVTALHRRHVLAWVAERGGIGVAAGAGFGVLLLLLAMIFGRPALAAVTASLLAGAIGGAVWGWISRPSVLRTVMEADRQLRLADLLSTAWAVRDNAGEPWRRTVSNLADAACQTVRPSEVLLRRWGARAWGAISLSTTLLLVIAVLVERPSTGLAGVQRDRPGEEPAAATPPNREHRTSTLVEPNTVTPGIPVHRDPEEGNPDAGSAAATDTKSERDAAGQTRHGPPSANASAQAGGGFAQSKAPPQSLRLDSHQGGHNEQADGTAAADGGSVADHRPRSQTGRASGSEAAASPRGRPAEGGSREWGMGAAGGWEAVEARPEYQPYRELIQAYFERP